MSHFSRYRKEKNIQWELGLTTPYAIHMLGKISEIAASEKQNENSNVGCCADEFFIRPGRFFM